MRVARLLKLFKHSQGLQAIGVVLLASAPSFSAISILVLLFWVVFGIVGMNVFGGIGMDQAYPNFDTFISSILISFQVRFGLPFIVGCLECPLRVMGARLVGAVVYGIDSYLSTPGASLYVAK